MHFMIHLVFWRIPDLTMLLGHATFHLSKVLDDGWSGGDKGITTDFTQHHFIFSLHSNNLTTPQLCVKISLILSKANEINEKENRSPFTKRNKCLSQALGNYSLIFFLALLIFSIDVTESLLASSTKTPPHIK